MRADLGDEKRARACANEHGNPIRPVSHKRVSENDKSEGAVLTSRTRCDDLVAKKDDEVVRDISHGLVKEIRDGVTDRVLG